MRGGAPRLFCLSLSPGPGKTLFHDGKALSLVLDLLGGFLLSSAENALLGRGSHVWGAGGSGGGLGPFPKTEQQ